MGIYRIGEIIREERNRRKISQEELCFGICSVTTLSRIENGSQKPSLKIEEALLERLGHSTENLVVYADDKEVKKHRLESAIRTRMMHFEDAGDLLAEYQKLLEKRGTECVLEEQFLVMSWAIQDFYQHTGESGDICKRLTEALCLTIPKYSESTLEDIKLLTTTEIEILNNLALAYAKEKEEEKALRIFRYLAKLLERDMSDGTTAHRHYNMILGNLARQLLYAQEYEEAEFFSRQGINYCKKRKRLNALPELLYYNATASFCLGRTEQAAERYQQAIALFRLLDRQDMAEAIREELFHIGNQSS